jgi:hypothetical protein
MPIGSPAIVLARQYATSGLPALTTTTETVVATISGLTQGSPPVVGGVAQSAPVRVSGIYNATPGTAATAITLRLRQGTTIAGTLVGTAQVTTVIAASPQSIAFAFEDTSGYLQSPAATPYVITAQQTTASANATSNTLEYEVSA